MDLRARALLGFAAGLLLLALGCRAGALAGPAFGVARLAAGIGLALAPTAHGSASDGRRDDGTLDCPFRCAKRFDSGIAMVCPDRTSAVDPRTGVRWVRFVCSPAP